MASGRRVSRGDRPLEGAAWLRKLQTPSGAAAARRSTPGLAPLGEAPCSRHQACNIAYRQAARRGRATRKADPLRLESAYDLQAKNSEAMCDREARATF